MNDYLRRLVDRYRPDRATAVVPNANLYVSPGAALEPGAPGAASSNQEMGADIEPTVDAPARAARAPAGDRSDSARARADSVAAPATMPPTLPADRVASRPVREEAQGTARPGREVFVGDGESPGLPTQGTAVAEPSAATSIHRRQLDPIDPVEPGTRAETTRPARANVQEAAAPAAAPTLMPAAAVPGIPSPGRQRPRAVDVQPTPTPTPTAREHIRAATWEPADEGRAAKRPMADETTGAEQPRTVIAPGATAGTRASARDGAVSDPPEAPPIRFRPQASGSDEARAGVVSPAAAALEPASPPPGSASEPGQAAAPPLARRARERPTSDAQPAASLVEPSPSPPGAAFVAPDLRPWLATAQDATMRRAAATFAAPEPVPDRPRAVSSPAAHAAEPARLVAAMPVQPRQPAVEKAARPTLVPAQAEAGSPRPKAPIVPATAPEPRRLPAATAAAAAAEAVSIRIGSVEFRAPPAPAPVPAQAPRAAAVAAPRLSLDEYLRGRRSRQP